MNDYLTPDAVSGLYERGAQELRTIGVTLMEPIRASRGLRHNVVCMTVHGARATRSRASSRDPMQSVAGGGIACAGDHATMM